MIVCSENNAIGVISSFQSLKLVHDECEGEIVGGRNRCWFNGGVIELGDGQQVER
jgi:hypothetical protein